MNILVIGGSKFIGWRLVELLGKTGHYITVINRGTHDKQYPKNVTHFVADRNDYEAMLLATDNKVFDVVYDMCGFMADDMKHVVRLFSKRAKKYVFISTAATYLEPITLPLREDSPRGSHRVWGKYGSGKLDCERILLEAYKDSGFPVVIIRPSYVYGVGNRIDRETFLFDRISNGRTILIPGAGEAVIQLGEVTDLCAALLCIAESPNGIGQCYNISGDEFLTLRSFVALVAQIMDKAFKMTSVDPAVYGLADRDIFPFDDVTYFTSNDKFSNDFTWEPKVPLIDGLSTAYDAWLKSSNKLQTNYKNEDLILAATG